MYQTCQLVRLVAALRVSVVFDPAKLMLNVQTHGTLSLPYGREYNPATRLNSWIQDRMMR